MSRIRNGAMVGLALMGGAAIEQEAFPSVPAFSAIVDRFNDVESAGKNLVDNTEVHLFNSTPAPSAQSSTRPEISSTLTQDIHFLELEIALGAAGYLIYWGLKKRS